MASRTLPGLGLKGFWLLGEDLWKDENDLNLLMISALLQARVISIVGATPGAPVDGDIHFFNSAHATQANKLAIRDNGGWIYIAAFEGLEVYNLADDTKYRFDGANLTAIAAASNIYSFGLSIVGTPTVGEVLLLHIVADAFTIPANFATPNSRGVVGTNPTASFVIDVQRQVNAAGAFASIGTITVSVGGVYTFATVGGTAKAIAANDVLKFIAPTPVDATFANAAITIRGTR